MTTMIDDKEIEQMHDLLDELNAMLRREASTPLVQLLRELRLLRDKLKRKANMLVDQFMDEDDSEMAANTAKGDLVLYVRLDCAIQMLKTLIGWNEGQAREQGRQELLKAILRTKQS